MFELIEQSGDAPSANPAPHVLEGHSITDTHHPLALEDTCDALMQLQVSRRALINDIGSAERRIGALARIMLHWRYDMPEAERTALNRRAAAMVKHLLEGKPIGDEVPQSLAAHAEFVRLSLEPLKVGRRNVEREMEAMAATLPAAGFVAEVRGFSIRGLAVIVGEAGNLSRYANPAKLWKRLGLAPYAGRAASTWRMKGGLSAADWSELGYSPARRGQLHGSITEPLMKMNDGKYRALYLSEKQRFVDAGKSERPAHAHNHASRVMTKELVLDVWRAWHGLPPRARQNLTETVQ